MRALDLYCGAGGASKGLVRAGFEVIGVDKNPQPHYPYQFIQADARRFPLDGFDFVWASPPCQKHTALKFMYNAKAHEDLIPETRQRLIESGIPFVIENVEGAPLHNPITLCGTHFDLGVAYKGRWFELQRHRLFEAHGFTIPQPICCHQHPVIGVYGGHVRCRTIWRNTGVDFPDCDRKLLASAALGIDWMTMGELSQAIPPDYAECIAHWAIPQINPQRAL